MLASVVNKIEMLGVQVEHIPGECTVLIQPVDAGFNKPFKGNVCNLWDEWLVNDGLNVDGTVKCPTICQIGEWIIAGMLMVSKRYVCNLWLHSPVNWFQK